MTMSSTVNAPATTLNMLPGLELEDARKAILSLDMSSAFTPQVEAYLRGLGDPRGIKRVGLVGQAVAASLILPALEMLGGLPAVALQGFGQQAGLLGWLELADYRHNLVRPRRADLANGDAFAGITVLDGGGRGITPQQKTELAALLNVEEDAIRVFDVSMGQVDMAAPQNGMVEKVIATGVTFSDLTSGRVLHLPAGSGLVAAVMATTIYGLSEAWPRTIRLNKGGDGAFHVEEIVDPQAMRQWGVALGREIEEAAPRCTLTGNLPEGFRQALANLAMEFGVEVRG